MNTNLGMKRPLDGERRDGMGIATRRSRAAERNTEAYASLSDWYCGKQEWIGRLAYAVGFRSDSASRTAMPDLAKFD